MFSYPQPEPLAYAYRCDPTPAPISRLGYATNNIYPNFPSNMCDSRSLVASYQPEAILNENLIKQSGVKSNWEYRKYLTEHSQEISETNFRESSNDCGYFERFRPSERGQNSNIPNNGMAYKDSDSVISDNSDLKQLYLSREELSKKYEPQSLTQDQLFSYMARK